MDKKLTWLLPVGGLTTLSLAGLLPNLIHSELAWFIYVVRELLNGATLPQDFFVNCIAAPPIWLAHVFGVPEIFFFYLYTGLLSILSLTLCGYILHNLIDSIFASRVLLLVLFYLFAVRAIQTDYFGHREHLLLVLVTPYLLASAGRAAGKPVSRKLALFSGALAGVGFALQPVFLLAWLVIELYLGLTRQAQPFWRSFEAVGPGLALIFYGLSFWLYAPTPALHLDTGLNTEIFQLLRQQLYSGSLILLPTAGQLVAVAVTAMLIIKPAHPTSTALRRILLIATLSFLSVALYQQKDWGIHFYPALATALLLLTTVALDLICRAQFMWLRSPLILGLTLVLLLQGGGTLLPAERNISISPNADTLFTPWLALDPSFAETIQTVKSSPGQTSEILLVSRGNYSARPLVNNNGTRWPLRFCCGQQQQSSKETDSPYWDDTKNKNLYMTPDTWHMTLFSRENKIETAHPPQLLLLAKWNADFAKNFFQSSRSISLSANYAALTELNLFDGLRPQLQVYQHLPEHIYRTSFTQTLRLVNPTAKSYVYAYLANNNQTETYLLDASSLPGQTYQVEWIIRPEQIWFKGDFLEKQSSIIALWPDRPLVVAVAFSDDPSRRPRQNVFERRFRFGLTAAGQIEILSPAEEWHNPRWPEASAWRMENIDHVLADRP